MIKFKKYILGIIASIFIIILMAPNISNAMTMTDYYIGMKNETIKIGDIVNIKYYSTKVSTDDTGKWSAQQPLFCAQHNTNTRETGKYKVVNILKIIGKTSTGIGMNGSELSISNKENAKLAYILNLGVTSESAEKRARQTAVWAVFNNLKNSDVGKKYKGYNSSTSLGKMINGGNPYQTSKGYTTKAIANRGKKIVSEAEEYAKTVPEAKTLNFKDNTDKNNLKVAQNGEYTIIGPYKWTFDGNITSSNININGMNADSEDVQIGSWVSSKWTKASKVTSNSEFYIAIKGSKLTEESLKIKVKITSSVKGVNVYFLYLRECQNLISFEPNQTEISTEWNGEYPIKGNLKVIKVDQDNNVVKLQGVGFKIQNKGMGKYVHQESDGTITYVDEANATEFVTDENGEFTINNLIIGTYIAYETKNPNVGYEIVNDGKTTSVTVDKTAELQIPNKKTTVNLSGFVWKDKIDGKQSVRNDLYKNDEYDTNDELMSNVTVKLIDKTTGDIVKNAQGEACVTKTDENGAYRFEYILVKDLSNYYVQFEYDGLVYTNVIKHTESDNGSKAEESTETRNSFNEKFAQVKGSSSRDTGYTRDSNGNITHSLKYTLANHTATLESVDNGGIAPITAETEEVTTTGKSYVADRYDELQAKDTSKPVEEITYINLGLYEREQPDLAIKKDVQNVKLSINGYNHVYTYAKRFENAGDYNGEEFNVGVKFGSAYGQMSYSQAIYRSDINYRNEQDINKELKVTVTYRISMKNESTSLNAKVNSIVDYYDSKYNLNAIGYELDANGSVINSDDLYKGNAISKSDGDEMEYDHNSYFGTTIYTNQWLEAQSEKSIYIQFELNKEATINILNNKPTLENVVEINNYSVFDKQEKLYAGIDKDSAPGNAIPGNTDTYEDDTDKAPALLLEAQDAATRKITGSVFEDEADPEKLKLNYREGNGQYDSNEHGIEGVTVKLISVTNNKQYGDSVKTDANGNFEFTEVVPDKYIVQYEWGGQKYNDTTYDVNNYKATIYHGAGEKWWEQETPRYSDATDDYATRKNIDNGKELIETMVSSTSSENPMDLGIEKGDTIIDTNITIVDGDKFVIGTYETKNIDLGIIERPRQQVGIEKQVSHVKITFANGTIAVDTDIVNGQPTTSNKILTSTGDKLWAQIDNELLQGSTLEVTYTIKVKNNSENDYQNEDFYTYGKESGNTTNPVTITPTGVNDYLDSEFAYDSSTNTDWEIVNKEENSDITQTIQKTVTQDGEGDWELVREETSEDGTITTFYNKKLASTKTDEETQTVKTWRHTIMSKKQEGLTDETVLKLKEGLVQPLEAGQENEKTLKTSKLLTNSNDSELVFDNKAELTQVDTSSGRTPLINTSSSTTFDEAEQVIVTPGTGSNKNYVTPIILGTTLLAIIGAGVFLIKKKVLRK